LIAEAGKPASLRFLEFFTVNIRNPNTRAAYARSAAGHFIRRGNRVAEGHERIQGGGSARSLHHRRDDLHFRPRRQVVALAVEDYYPQKKHWWLKLHGKNGKVNEMPSHPKLAVYLNEYIEAVAIASDRKGPLFCSAIRKTKTLTALPLSRNDVWHMVRRRAKDAGIETAIGCHTFRATGLTDYLTNGGPSKWPSAWPDTPTPKPPACTTGAPITSAFLRWPRSGFEYNVCTPLKGRLGPCDNQGMLRAIGALVLAAAVLTAATTSSSGGVTITPLPANTVANAIQTDAAGNLYLAGLYIADSSNPNAPAHVFVSKLSPDASQTIWSTQLAGTGNDYALALALGPNGAVYVTGMTQSTNFPATPGAFATSGNTFVTELSSSSGGILYSTYVPATSGQAIVVDSAGDAFITGTLEATDAFQATPEAVMGNISGLGNGYSSGYVIELNPTGTAALLAIAGFGGSQIALDAQGDIFAAGSFLRGIAPTTAGVFQTQTTQNICSSSQVFVEYCAYQHIAKIDPAGTKLLYATYIAGSYGATISGLVIDSEGNAILAGSTESSDYPTTPNAYQQQYFPNPAAQSQPPASFGGPPSSGYITKLNATGTALLWSTFLGGTGAYANNAADLIIGDSISGLATDASGNILVAGFAHSPDFPGLWNTPVASRPAVTMEAQPNPPGFVARLTPDGSELAPVELLTGFSRDLAQPTGRAAAVGVNGNAVAVGSEVVIAAIAALGQVAAICDAADDAKIVSVAPGELLTLYGANLSTQITFNNVPATLLYSSPDQINLQVPASVAGQSQVTMQVGSESYILAVNAIQPGLFLNPSSFDAPLFDEVTCDGQNFAAVQPLALNADGSVNSCSNPASQGSRVTIFLNGASGGTPFELSSAGASAPAKLAAQALPGAITGVVEAQVPVPTTSSAVLLGVVDSSGTLHTVRGPGVAVWVSSTPASSEGASFSNGKRGEDAIENIVRSGRARNRFNRP
jgi:uncharacterized protein (TIGR03437 family)